jgi:hypothetical protein
LLKNKGLGVGAAFANSECAESEQTNFEAETVSGENMNSQMQKRSIPWVASLVLAGAAMFWPAAAHADTYIDYSVDGTFDSGGTLSGSFTVDETTDIITTANITADGVDFTCPDGLGNGCILYTTLAGGIADGFLAGPEPTQFLFLDWVPSDPSVLSFSPGSYCQGCLNASSQDFLVSGTGIDGPTSAPEPGTWVLLLAALAGLGLLGLRRRATAGAVTA